MLLKKGKTRSCGCLFLKSKTKHDLYKTRVYSIWHNMIGRCNNKNNKYYGGRQIKVIDKWKNENGFKMFLQDMEGRPKNCTFG